MDEIQAFAKDEAPAKASEFSGNDFSQPYALCSEVKLKWRKTHKILNVKFKRSEHFNNIPLNKSTLSRHQNPFQLFPLHLRFSQI